MGLITPLAPFCAPKIVLPRYSRHAQSEAPIPITCSGLTATPGLGQVLLAWTVTDANYLSGYQLAAVEVWMAKSNDRTQASHYGETSGTSLTHIWSPQSGTNYYWIRARDRSGNYGPWYPSGGNAGVAATPNNIPQVPGIAVGNVAAQINASVAAGALTIALKNSDGSDPSESSPLMFGFRNLVASGGSARIRSVTAPTSITIASGFKVGTLDTIPFALWVVLIDNGSSVFLGVINCNDSGGVTLLNEQILMPVWNMFGADTPGKIYASSSGVDYAICILGRLEWNTGLVTAGTWNAPPDFNMPFGPGSHRPGEVVREWRQDVTAVSTSATAIPFDDTIPQSNEGGQHFLISDGWLTSFVNLVEHELLVNVSPDADDTVTASVFITPYSGNVDALAAGSQQIANGKIGQIKTRYCGLAFGANWDGSYSARIGMASGGTVTLNGVGGGRKLGGKMMSSYVVREIMG